MNAWITWLNSVGPLPVVLGTMALLASMELLTLKKSRPRVALALGVPAAIGTVLFALLLFLRVREALT